MVKNKEIKKANKEFEYLTGEAYERRLAYLVDKTQRDFNTQMAVGTKIAMEKRNKKAE